MKAINIDIRIRFSIIFKIKLLSDFPTCVMFEVYSTSIVLHRFASSVHHKTSSFTSGARLISHCFIIILFNKAYVFFNFSVLRKICSHFIRLCLLLASTIIIVLFQHYLPEQMTKCIWND